MSIPDRPLTWEDLEPIPYDGKRHEIIDGEYFTSPVPPRVHQGTLGNLLLAVSREVQEDQKALVLPGIFNVRFSQHDQVQPDLIYVRAERQHLCAQEAMLAAPDLIVEVTTHQTKIYDETKKAQLYARYGVPEYWVADPYARTLQILTPRGDEYHAVIPEDDGRLRSVILPNLALDPQKVLYDPDDASR